MRMTPRERQLYRQEIEELTGFLRDAPEWDDLRSVLGERQVRPSDSLLAAFMEDEEGMEYAVLITGEGRVIESHRRVGPPGHPGLLVWRDRTGDPKVYLEYPQVTVALEMCDMETRPAAEKGPLPGSFPNRLQ